MRLNKNISLIENSNNRWRAAWSLINKFRNGTGNKNIIPLSSEIMNNCFINSVEEIRTKIVKPKISHMNLLNNCTSPVINMDWKEVSSNQVLHIVSNLKMSYSIDIYDMSNNF